MFGVVLRTTPSLQVRSYLPGVFTLSEGTYPTLLEGFPLPGTLPSYRDPGFSKLRLSVILAPVLPYFMWTSSPVPPYLVFPSLRNNV